MKPLVFLLYIFVFNSYAKSDQITFTYKITDAQTKKLTYWSLYFDIKNEKISEAFSNQNKQVQNIITYTHLDKTVQYIDYVKRIVFHSKASTKHILPMNPKIKYLKTEKCTLYFYKNKLARCFQEDKYHFELKDIDLKKLKEMYFSYIGIMGPELDKLPLYDSILKFEVKQLVDREIRTDLFSINFNIMGRNDINLPKTTLLRKVPPKNCFYKDCFLENI